MKKNLPTAILIVILVVGISLLLYPSVSDYWNSFNQTKAITEYTENVANLNDEEYERLWHEAETYNSELLGKANRFHPSDVDHERYLSLLNIAGLGIMGYLEMPVINVRLPLYHGVDSAVLQFAVGHIEGTSLPVGGAGTHCALSGHRGLPSATLLSNLDKVAEGDVFYLRVLNETLTYEVDQIRIVEPKDISDLAIDPEQDYCTLVTCTPYGINTHRLLVRGHRIPNGPDADGAALPADAVQIDPTIVAPIVATPILLVLVGYVLVRNRKHT